MIEFVIKDKKNIGKVFAIAAFIWVSCNNPPPTKNTIKNDTIKEPSTSHTKNVIIDSFPIINELTINNLPTQVNVPLLFWLRGQESKSRAFISLSDIHRLSYSDHPDSLSLPPLENKEIEPSKYIVLSGKYRNRLLKRTGLSEEDSVFVYDYSINKLMSCAIKNLRAAAWINDYASDRDWPFSESDYMFGFEVMKKDLKGFKDTYYEVLVAVSRENPFTGQQLIPIKWNRIKAKDFPAIELKDEYKKYIPNLTKFNMYSYKTDSLIFCVQDYDGIKRSGSFRRLLAVQEGTHQLIREMIFTESEGTSLSELNGLFENDDIQWMGNLFKNTPPIVLGFEWVSFGCPSISIIDTTNRDIFINCDNRH